MFKIETLDDFRAALTQVRTNKARERPQLQADQIHHAGFLAGLEVIVMLAEDWGKSLEARGGDVLGRARDAVETLIHEARPDGPLAGNPARGLVSSRAKWLRNALARAAGDPDPNAPPDDTALDYQADISRRIDAARAEWVRRARERSNPGPVED